VNFDWVLCWEKLYSELDVDILSRSVFPKPSIKSSRLQEVKDELFPRNIHIQKASHTTVAVLVSLERFKPGESHGVRSKEPFYL
jgi:hypothetical protein